MQRPTHLNETNGQYLKKIIDMYVLKTCPCPYRTDQIFYPSIRITLKGKRQ